MMGLMEMDRSHVHYSYSGSRWKPVQCQQIQPAGTRQAVISYTCLEDANGSQPNVKPRNQKL